MANSVFKQFKYLSETLQQSNVLVCLQTNVQIISYVYELKFIMIKNRDSVYSFFNNCILA